MSSPRLEIRITEHKGRGLFTLDAIASGCRIITFTGTVLKTDELTDDMLAMQVGPDDWLCSDGESLDDCANHSCDPNAGFAHGEVALFALREIAAGEEITWDYSTSMGWPGWTLECRCGTARCRGIIQSYSELSPADRERLADQALAYLKG